MLDPTRILIPVRHADRGDMVTQMFAAAELLGIARHEIRSQTEGFNVPRPVAAYLFPSLFPDEVVVTW